MPKPLADVIAELSRSGSTGILSVSVRKDEALLKIFFRGGSIYHITHGTCRDMECITKLPGLDIESGFFIPGAHVDMPDQTLPPTEELISQIRSSEKVIRWEESAASRTDNSSREAGPSKSGFQEGIIDVGTIARMETELVNIVGPIAPILLDNAYNKCNIKKGVPITAPEFKRLISLVSEKLPAEQKGAFIARFT
jgi:hypothetical protein